MVALQKPNTGVRGLVIGDVLRQERHVALHKCLPATPTQHAALTSLPFQLGLALGRSFALFPPLAAQSYPLTALVPMAPSPETGCFKGYTTPPEPTVVYHAHACGTALSPSTFGIVWHDAHGRHHAALHGSSQVKHDHAFLDSTDSTDTFMQQNRARPVSDLVAHRLETHARIRLDQSKARVWNRSGVSHPAASAQETPNIVWHFSPIQLSLADTPQALANHYNQGGTEPTISYILAEPSCTIPNQPAPPNEFPKGVGLVPPKAKLETGQ